MSGQIRAGKDTFQGDKMTKRNKTRDNREMTACFGPFVLIIHITGCLAPEANLESRKMRTFFSLLFSIACFFFSPVLGRRLSLFLPVYHLHMFCACGHLIYLQKWLSASNWQRLNLRFFLFYIKMSCFVHP